jgi:BirA family biotin operon repressor/biotin-[acetyl-CoA-carboxylase] ligase
MRLLDDLAPLLTTRRFGRAARGFDTIGSTNAEAAAWAADGAPEGALVLAEHQQAGRGRLGRTWAAAPGLNLTQSLVLRPSLNAERLGLLPLAAGLAVAEAVERAAGVPARVKWPNDVLIGGRKACGLLAEAAHGKGQGGAVILGIGLNVNQQAFPPELSGRATSVALEAGRPIDRATLLAALLAALESRYDTLHAGGADALIRGFEERMDGLGRAVTVRSPNTTRPDIDGLIRGVAPDGALRLETSDGERRLYAGEVTLAAPAETP